MGGVWESQEGAIVSTFELSRFKVTRMQRLLTAPAKDKYKVRDWRNRFFVRSLVLVIFGIVISHALMVSKAFADCSLVYLEKTFGLIQQFDCPVLDGWLARPAELSDHERRELRDFQEPLIINVLHWNEHELSLNFIGPLLALIRFTDLPGQRFNLFAQRLVRGSVGEIELFGKPDGMIASGFREPEQPFFAFSEYKRNIDPNGDPAGQCLAAMLVGQTLSNSPDKPMYGCFVVGRDWSFVTLVRHTYCISPDYSALTNDIFDIFRILKALRQIIVERVAAMVTD